MLHWVVFNAVPPTYSASMDQQGSAEDRASVATTHPTELWEHFRREVRKRANTAGDAIWAGPVLTCPCMIRCVKTSSMIWTEAFTGPTRN